jgi:hypothetical protein
VNWYDEIPCRTDPRSNEALRAHLVGDHNIPPTVLDEATTKDWRIWHDGDHSTRHPKPEGLMHKGHLRHTHERFVPKK